MYWKYHIMYNMNKNKVAIIDKIIFEGGFPYSALPSLTRWHLSFNIKLPLRRFISCAAGEESMFQHYAVWVNFKFVTVQSNHNAMVKLIFRCFKMGTLRIMNNDSIGKIRSPISSMTDCA